MEAIRFSVYAPKPKQVVIYEYYMSGFLKSIYLNDNCNGGFAIISIVESPIKITYEPGTIPPEFKKMQLSGCEVRDITTVDLSFEKFIDIYQYKRGNLVRAKKLHGKLSDHERILALGFIRKLKATYERERKEMPYPETYLSQKRWENEL
jgi:hypothetical protein